MSSLTTGDVTMKLYDSLKALFFVLAISLIGIGCSADNHLVCFDDSDCPADCECVGELVLPFDCVKKANPEEFCVAEDAPSEPADDCSDVTAGDGSEDSDCSDDSDCDSSLCCTPDKSNDNCNILTECTCQQVTCLDLAGGTPSSCELDGADIGDGSADSCCNQDSDCDSNTCDTDVCECQ